MKFVLNILFVSMLILGLGCKKKSKELTTVNFHLYNPVSNEAYAGVKVSILQEKNTSKGFNSSSETEVIWQGVTDASGKASHSFKAYNNQQYFYWQDVENSFVQNPNMELLQLPAFLPLNKNEVNEVVYGRVIKYVDYITWRKNVNCFDENDKCRMRSREYFFWANTWDEWSNWGGGGGFAGAGYYEGCYESMSTPTHTKKIIQFQMEVTRNNVVDTIEKTFYITGPNGTDTLKLFY